MFFGSEPHRLEAHAAAFRIPAMRSFLAAAASLAVASEPVVIDWAKCCDCELPADMDAAGLLVSVPAAAVVKVPGEACRVTVPKGGAIRFLFEGAQWQHNLVAVASEESCEATETVVGGVGGPSMDETVEFPAAGVFHYACTHMCTDETALGGTANDAYCHCTAFSHKLVVTVDELEAGDSGSGSGTSGAFSLAVLAISAALL